jgi:hypothetical protein
MPASLTDDDKKYCHTELSKINNSLVYVATIFRELKLLLDNINETSNRADFESLENKIVELKKKLEEIMYIYNNYENINKLIGIINTNKPAGLQDINLIQINNNNIIQKFIVAYYIIKYIDNKFNDNNILIRKFKINTGHKKFQNFSILNGYNKIIDNCKKLIGLTQNLDNFTIVFNAELLLFYGVYSIKKNINDNLNNIVSYKKPLLFSILYCILKQIDNINLLRHFERLHDLTGPITELKINESCTVNIKDDNPFALNLKTPPKEEATGLKKTVFDFINNPANDNIYIVDV